MTPNSLYEQQTTVSSKYFSCRFPIPINNNIYLCKLRAILLSRLLRGVYTLVKDVQVGDSPGKCQGQQEGVRRSALLCARKLYNPH